MKSDLFMMAACMVTCGRGLDDFVCQEILEKIPGTVDMRHLGEGKLAFRICQAVNTTDTTLKQGQKGDGDKGCLGDGEENRAARKDHNVTSTVPNKVIGTKEVIEEQKTGSLQVTEPSGISTEDENQWADAVSPIYKLRLVERVFTLLHCEDIDSQENIAGVGNARPDNILKTYESKIESFIESIKWNDLAVKLKKVKDRQDEGRSRPVWCQDPDSCPGTLRRRQTKQELREKRAASVSSGDIQRHLSKHPIEDSITENEKKKMKVSEVSDSDLKTTVLNSECENESVKLPVIFGSNTADNNNVFDCNELKADDLKNKIQYSQRSHKEDANGVCVSNRGTDAYKDNIVIPTNSNPTSKGKLNLIQQEDSKLTLSKGFQESICPPSQMDLDLEELKGEVQAAERKSTKDVLSTFRVSSRVSGPNKHVVNVKWLNHIFGQHLTKAMPGWVPDWRQPLVDLYVNITSTHYIIGAALSPRSLSLRTYIPHLTLRSTICHLMARLACLSPKAVVLDPMCGGGSILVETAVNFDVSHVIASDSSQEQLKVARCNLHNLRIPVTFLQAHAQALPLQDSSVNTVLCDFPFGQKHKLTSESQQLLAEVLKEMHRVLVCGGRAVFLLSPRQSEAVIHLAQDKTKTSSTISFGGSCLILLESHSVSLGETSACVAVLAKEHSSPEASKEEEGGASL